MPNLTASPVRNAAQQSTADSWPSTWREDGAGTPAENEVPHTRVIGTLVGLKSVSLCRTGSSNVRRGVCNTSAVMDRGGAQLT